MKAEGRNRTSNAVKKLSVDGKDTKDASKILSIRLWQREHYKCFGIFYELIAQDAIRLLLEF